MASLPPAFILDLPDEIITAILSLLDPASLCRTKAASRRLFVAASEPFLWRNICRQDYEYWSQEHRFTQLWNPRQRQIKSTPRRLPGIDGLDFHDINWEKAVRNRIEVERETAEHLHGIIDSQTGRIARFEKILGLGFDAKDYLLAQSRAPIESSDGLSRRYHANAALRLLQRAQAIDMWADLELYRTEVAIALAGFDSFSLVGGHDLEAIEKRLDDVATEYIQEYPAYETMTTREKAFSLCAFLRSGHFLGISDESDFKHLEYSFIGLAAIDKPASSFPLISCALFSAIAKRVGVVAHPISYPWHVYLCVFAEPGKTLDGGQRPTPIRGDETNTNEHLTRMFLDPWRTTEEIPHTHLRGQLTQLGLVGESAEMRLSPLTTPDAVQRCTLNIRRSVLGLHHLEEGFHQNLRRTHPLCDQALYSALWTEMLFGSDERSLDDLVHFLQYNYPMDVPLLLNHWPDRATPEQSKRFSELHHVIRTADMTPKKLSRRVPDDEQIIYKIGQVFRHKRYGFMGVISGWDRITNPEPMLTDQPVLRCPAMAKHKTFYHVLVEDQTMRYIAEANIAPVWPQSLDEVDDYLLQAAGRYFKRWDEERRMFESNVRDEYPDD